MMIEQARACDREVSCLVESLHVALGPMNTSFEHRLNTADTEQCTGDCWSSAAAQLLTEKRPRYTARGW